MARIRLAVLLSCAALLRAGAMSAAVQAPEAATTAGGTVTELDQVDVVGRSLRQVQRELVKAQDRFFARYNDLNTTNDFDVHCSYRATTGSQRRVRECQVEFVQEVTGQQGRDFLEAILSRRLAFASETPPASIEWLKRREAFRENVRQAIHANPDLQDLIRKWLALQDQYDKVLKAREQR